MGGRTNFLISSLMLYIQTTFIILCFSLPIYSSQPLQFKPVPLTSTEAGEYMLALKQEFRGIMQESEYFIKPDIVKKGIIF